MIAGTTRFPEDAFLVKDIYVIKINSEGEVVWEKTIGWEKSEICEGVVETSNGEYIIMGQTSSFISGSQLLLVKT